MAAVAWISKWCRGVHVHMDIPPPSSPVYVERARIKREAIGGKSLKKTLEDIGLNV